MRFDQHDNPPTILTARDQRRLILMGLSLMVVIFAIKVAAKPEFWARLFPSQPAATDNLPDEEATASLEPARTDRSNEVLVEPAADPVDINALTDTSVTSDSNGPSQFPSTMLREIRDNSLGVRYRETPAYYTMLAAARRVKNKVLETQAERNVTFPVLMSNPKHYRGRAVTISGKLRRIEPFTADPNNLGIEQLYDAWVFPRDAGAKPVHIVCSTIHETIDETGTLKEPVDVRVTGYFFKREAYSTQANRLNIVPLVLASHIGLEPVTETLVVNDGSMEKYLFWFSLAVAVAIGLTLWNFTVSDWEFRTSRVARSLDPPRNVDLHGIDSVEIGQVLQDLAQTDNSDNQSLIR